MGGGVDCFCFALGPPSLRTALAGLDGNPVEWKVGDHVPLLVSSITRVSKVELQAITILYLYRVSSLRRASQARGKRGLIRSGCEISIISYALELRRST